VRGLLLSVAAVAFLAPIALASQRLRPPVIHETFTALPCPRHPQTTVALEGCAEKVILVTDRRINTRVARIFRLLRAGQPRVDFVASEQAWLRYRRRSCEAEGSFYAGGSMQPLANAECVGDRNRSHLSDLAKLLKVLSTR
jgi:uncharacterized protein YecT (DUF1311 family)